MYEDLVNHLSFWDREQSQDNSIIAWLDRTDFEANRKEGQREKYHKKQAAVMHRILAGRAVDTDELEEVCLSYWELDELRAAYGDQIQVFEDKTSIRILAHACVHGEPWLY